MHARIYFTLALLIAAVTLSCGHDVTGPENVADDNQFRMKFGGALAADFESSDGISRNYARLMTIRDQQYLDLFFGVSVRGGTQEQEGITRVRIPVVSEDGTLKTRVMEFSESGQAVFDGSSSFSLSVHDQSALRAVYDFQATALQFRVTEFSDARIAGRLNMAAKQTRGLRNSYGQVEEVQLANEGRIGVAIEFDIAIADF